MEQEYELVCDDSFSDDMIGFWNLGNARKILSLLYEGHTLQYRHIVFGVVNVNMNPQGNRLIVTKNETMNENNIMSYIIWLSGKWYKVKEAQIKEGYILKDGTPLKCLKCDSKDITNTNYDLLDSQLVCEYEVKCNACNSIVGRWAYGRWSLVIGLYSKGVAKLKRLSISL